MLKSLSKYNALALVALLPAAAHAQFEMAGEASASTDGEANADGEATAETEAPEEQERPEPDPEPEPERQPKAEEEKDAAGGLALSAFVDAYLTLQTARMGTAVPAHRAYVGSIRDTPNDAGFVSQNGFALSWAGVDVAYDAGKAGATLSLRAGPSLPIYYGYSNANLLGLDNITQAFVTFKPTDGVVLDLGQFTTIFGAEVAESWQNLNYTRGGLYYAMQPFWHTGLRAGFELTSDIGLNALLVDGVNTISEAQDQLGLTSEPVFYPTVGAQVTYASRKLDVAAGGLWGTETNADAFNVFFDVVATVKLDPLTLIFNADYNVNQLEDLDSLSFFGVSAAAGYKVDSQIGLALRLEHLVDSDNSLYGVPDLAAIPVVPLDEAISVTTVTGTVDFRPLSSDTLVIRWDNRYELGSHDVFFDTKGDPADTWFMSTLGVVVQGG